MNIKAYRNENGLSQENLAEKLGVTQGCLSDIERGRRGVSKAVALRLHEIDPGRFSLVELLSISQTAT